MAGLKLLMNWIRRRAVEKVVLGYWKPGFRLEARGVIEK